MADFVTAHIKIEDSEWQRLGSLAQNHDLTTAQLVRKILRGWLDSQVFVQVTQEGPVRAQTLGHTGYDPNPHFPDGNQFLVTTERRTLNHSEAFNESGKVYQADWDHHKPLPGSDTLRDVIVSTHRIPGQVCDGYWVTTTEA